MTGPVPAAPSSRWWDAYCAVVAAVLAVAALAGEGGTRGLTNADIGRQLFISEATVKTHLLRAFSKLDVADRTAAVTTAMEHGLL